MAADDSRDLVVRSLVSMRVDGGGARLQPYAGWPIGVRDRPPDRARREYARVHNLAAVVSGVPAVDAAAGEVDQHVGAIDLVGPRTRPDAVPLDHAPGPALSGVEGSDLRTTTENDHVVALRMEGSGEQCAHLARAARYDDFHGIIIIVNMFTKNKTPRKRGRPPGRTVEGEATRTRLYETAVQLIGEQGYEATTL